MEVRKFADLSFAPPLPVFSAHWSGSASGLGTKQDAVVATAVMQSFHVVLLCVTHCAGG